MAKFKSLRDMGYQQAKTGDSLSEQAQYAMENIAGFPAEKPSSEARAALYEGYHLRYAENHAAVVYAVINDHYVKASPEQVKNGAVEKIEIGIAYAYSYSSQEFGKLANTNPAMHGLVKQIRSDVSDYCSNRLGDLARAARALMVKTTSARVTLDFSQSMTKAFDAQEKSVKVKQGRGDTTANTAKFAVAVKAFWTTYNA